MKTVLKKTIKIQTDVHNFANGISYIENYRNGVLQDCFFADRDDLFPNGSLKPDRPKLFFLAEGEAEKSIQKIDVNLFDSFDRLFYFDGAGRISKYNDFTNS